MVLAPQAVLKRNSAILAGLFALAFGVRLVYLFAVVHPTPLVGDEPDYYELAEYLSNGQGFSKVPQQSADGIPYPTAYRTPGPSAIYAAVFCLTGPSILSARLVSVVFASSASPLMYLFARNIGGTFSAVLAGIFISIYPSWVYYSVWVLSEPIYVPLFLAALTLTASVVESPRYWPWFALGMIWGLLALVRPHALPCAAMIFFLVFCQRPRLAARILVFGVGFGLILGSWATRNYYEVGHPVPLATEGGETLLGSNNPYVWNDPEMSGMWKAPTSIPEYYDHLLPIQGEVERDREQNRIAVAFMKENASSLPEQSIRKLWRWLTPLPHSGGKARILVLASYGPLLVALLLGILTGAVRRSFPLTAVIAISLASCVITVVYWGNLTRGRLPLELVWLPWASMFAWNAFEKMAAKLRGEKRNGSRPVV